MARFSHSPVRELPAGFWRRLRSADANVMAAAVAFNVFFALVPMALAVVALASLLIRDQQALERGLEAVEPIAPAPVTEFLRDVVTDAQARLVGGGGTVAIVVAAGLAALFFGSRAVGAMQRALARLEGMREHRPRWRIRLIGMFLTLSAGTALLASALLLVVGGTVAVFLEDSIGAGALGATWRVVRVPAAFAGLVLFLRVLYQWGPPRPLPAIWVASLVATAGVVLASLGFGLYLANADVLGNTFGALGAVAVFLAWLYLVALATLVGAALVTSTWRWRQIQGRPAPLPHVTVVAVEREAAAVPVDPAPTGG